MRKIFLIIVSIVSIVMLSGCATILGGGNRQVISVNSDKPVKGTLVYSDGKGKQYFTTPATLMVDRRQQDINITSTDNSFDTKTVKSNLNPWFYGNIIIGGLFGSTTDGVGGAMWKYDETVNLHNK